MKGACVRFCPKGAGRWELDERFLEVPTRLVRKISLEGAERLAVAKGGKHSSPGSESALYSSADWL